MRRLIATVAVVGLGGLVLAGCSGGGSSPEEEPAAPTLATSASSTPSPSPSPLDGEAEAVSVASITLPGGPTWIRAIVDGDPDVEEVRWTANDDTGAIGCRVVVTVQNPFPGTMAAYRTFLETTTAETLEGIDPDPGAPDGTEGILARYAGGGDAVAIPFTSTLRTWLTGGGTKISVSASTSESMSAQCDPSAIVGSLVWDGTERPAPANSPDASTPSS